MSIAIANEYSSAIETLLLMAKYSPINLGRYLGTLS